MLRFAIFFCGLVIPSSAGDITNCAADVFKNCQVDEYWISTLEIIDREISRGKADEYYKRQICTDIGKQKLDSFKNCVTNINPECWRWTDVFDSLRQLQDPKDIKISRRLEQTYVMVQYDVRLFNCLRFYYTFIIFVALCQSGST